MAKANREKLSRVNFFDGQRVTEADLDDEQIHHRGLVSSLTKDFHGSGIVRDRLFESYVLLDTSDPGTYLDDDEENESEFVIDSGSYDGKAIFLDRQPSDTVYGNRLEIEATGLDVGGRLATKVLIVGAAFSSLSDSGELVSEVLEFKENGSKVTENYYVRVVSVFFNNFSGGTGRTENSLSEESLNLLGEDGKILIKEAEPFNAFARTQTAFQIKAPNIELANFITSSEELSIEDEIKNGLGSVYNFNDLYFELNSKEEIAFEVDGNQTVSYGQKFLAKADNVQKVDLLFSVKEDEAAASGEEYNFSGDIVISIHRLSTDIQCITDPHPDNLIDFDPEPSPLIEMSYSQEDLEALGYKLNGTPQVVSFDFSGTLIADPGIDPSLEVDEYYAVLVSRRGDNRTGTIVMQKGYDKVSKKTNNGQTLNVTESFGKQTSRFIEFDPNNLVYVDDMDSSLWFVVHSDTIEVTDGIAYTDDGLLVILPKTEEYVGSTEISYFMRNVGLSDVSEGTDNLLVLQRQDDFVTPGIHPRTGNFVNTRVQDSPSVSIMTTKEWEDVDENYPPILLARIRDNNVREAQDITGTFDRPGLLGSDEIIFVEPDSDMLTENLINRIITPDMDCECNSRYRIVAATCAKVYAGDLDNDGEITSSDIVDLLNVVGNTINTETTERRILGGELDLIDFIKSDLNDDGTVDGTDIELIEDAVDGYVNFSVEEAFDVLTLKLENILEEDNYPVLFDSSDSTDSAASGATSSGEDTVSFTTELENQALAIRLGDQVTIPSDSSDAGVYLVYSKTVDETGTGVVLSVTDTDGVDVSFSGSSGFDLTVASGTRVNLYADNPKLLDVPYAEKNWSISYIGAPHQSDFLDVCDLRRYVETNFIEEFEETCVCDEDLCIEEDDCTPLYKNQKVLPNDLFIPSGEIYKEPGVPYHGDIEYSTITIPLPPGTIDDCEVDLYTNFIKADSGKCKTESGYPAMKFSDGTYVGCGDSGAETDITKGRVKITQCIASLYVDAFVDGYAIDGYADEEDISTSAEVIADNFTDYTYPNSLGFSEWAYASAGSYVVASALSGWNEPVYFDLETINAGERYARLSYPSGVDDISGDFVIDVRMSRTIWDQNELKFGKVGFFTTLVITNDDGTECTLKLGWRQSAYENVELFYSGEIVDISAGTVISDFDFSVEASDDLGDEIRFRLRRVDEAVFAMYYDDTLLDFSENITGQFIRIGEAPDVQPGSGDAQAKFEIAQYDNPNVGVIYATTLHDLVIRHSYSSESSSEEDSITISRDSDSLINRATVTFPILLTQRTNIISATLSMTAADVISSEESFNIIPYDILNADNLGTLIDYPLEENDSFVVTFEPGDVSVGGTIDVDVTTLAIYFLSKPGHLPGFYKAVIIEPSATAEATIAILPSMTLTIEYEDVTTGVIFKVGASLDSSTGIVSLQTKNILYDSLNEANRTVLKFGVHLKKSGFANDDITIGIKDLARVGIGTCVDETEFEEDELCYFIAGSTATGTFVEGPFPCYFHLP
ncbi:hypothetical protein CMI47_03215 [Candidatus Pacearchaeota archaeon]|nr:hypothetical protein [Candidatus Pacearchaeota archaeon]